jgi:hypothetical protein
MQNYIYSKTPSTIDQGWFYWKTPDFQKINPDLDQVAALIFIMRKKEIGIIYKPTPVLDAEKKKLLGIIGNMLEEGSEDPQFPDGRQTALKLPLALANTTKSSTRVNLLS